MGSIMMALFTFGCTCGGILSGSLLRNRLPEHHLSDDSKDAVKVGTGFIATLTALVLGLLISSAKTSYDAVNVELVHSCARVLALDQILQQYGPEAREIRRTLRSALAGAIALWWPEEKAAIAEAEAIDAQRGMALVRSAIHDLSPHDAAQKWLQDQALQAVAAVRQGRWEALVQTEVSLPMPFLVVLISWLTILFACFSLLAPRNRTVVAVLLLCALSVSGAVFLLQEMSRSETGLLKVSCAPMLKALSLLGQ